MIKIYGSKLCPDCRNCKLNFDKYHIEYEFIEITESMKNLKEFLHYRDTRKDIFDRLIKIGDVGIPCLVEGDNIFTDWEGYLKDKGFNHLEYEVGKSCSLDGKGC